MVKVIIEADDFGMSEAINLGIIKSFRDGITTSTLLMPNLDAVDENGHFHRSSYYRNNPELKFVYEDVRTETLAQQERFKELMGHYPAHIDCHSMGDEIVDQAFFDIACEYGIHIHYVAAEN